MDLRLRRFAITAVSSLIGFVLQSDAATVAIYPAKDNTIYSEGALSNGQGEFLFAGKNGESNAYSLRRSLLAFDIAGALPANAIITDVSLTLYLSRAAFGTPVVETSLHRALADWGEGASDAVAFEGAGAAAQAGDATWNFRFFGDSATAWSNPGGDFSSQPSATAAVGSVYPMPIQWSGAGMLADVKSWFTSPSTNFGWVLKGDESVPNSARQFHSGENASMETRPVLTVTYDVVPEPGTASLVAVGIAALAGRTRRRRRPIALAVLAVGLMAASSQAAGPIAETIAKGTIRVDLQPFASGLTAPNLLISPQDGTDRQFILDQDGQIYVSQNGVMQSTPFLDASANLVSLTASYDERGLLGMAFDPGFSNPLSPGYRRVFTYTSEATNGPADLTTPSITTLNHQSVISSWQVDPANPNRVLPGSRQVILRIDQPQTNHNGGMIAFGPDNMLYIGLGDGGGANDNNTNGHNATIGNGQDNNTALGKILRIDVNGTNSANGKYGIPATNPFAAGGGVKEIYASGFRNAYRFSFDGNKLLVGDVGQNNVEEVDNVVLGGNYGWRYKEGTFKFDPATGNVSSDLTGVPAGLIDPIFQYDHDEGISVIGGFVYHGTLIPALVGKYVFGDFGLSFANPTGRLFYADLQTNQIREFLLGANDQPLGLFLKGMGQDQNGEIYVLGGTSLGPTGTTGVVLKMVPEPGTVSLFLAGIALLAGRRRRET